MALRSWSGHKSHAQQQQQQQQKLQQQSWRRRGRAKRQRQIVARCPLQVASCKLQVACLLPVARCRLLVAVAATWWHIISFSTSCWGYLLIRQELLLLQLLVLLLLPRLLQQTNWLANWVIAGAGVTTTATATATAAQARARQPAIHWACPPAGPLCYCCCCCMWRCSLSMLHPINAQRFIHPSTRCRSVVGAKKRGGGR